MKSLKLKSTLLVIIILPFVIGCATFRSNMVGKYESTPEKNFNAKGVKVGFIFSHYHQVKGLDVIPKLEDPRGRIRGFDDLFLDALKEFSNIKSYNTYTNYSSDVNEPKRRALRDSLINHSDFVIEMRILNQRSFAKHFFGVLGSTLTATILPIPYKYNYYFNVEVFDKNHALVKTYSRSDAVTKWVETLMIFLYPFYPEDRVKEELYVNCLHDVFKQIESEKILNKTE